MNQYIRNKIVYIFHLCTRFFGSVFARKLTYDESIWVSNILTKEERLLWDRMIRADARHAYTVAKTVEHMLPLLRMQSDDFIGENDIFAAALLHDIGKIESKLTIFGRVLATVIRPLLLQAKQNKFFASNLFKKYYRYYEHPEIDSQLLVDAGSAVLPIQWAKQHHESKQQWLVQREIGELLKAADND